MNNNKPENISLIHKGLKRITTFDIEFIFSWIKKNPDLSNMEWNGYKINMKRSKIFFKKGIVCSRCGASGKFFALEEDKGGGIHLDLYGFIDNEEVLITVDHIIPKAKGGQNKMINYQIMCKLCNELKSDYIK